MIIFGIDPGFARMGAAVLEKDDKGKEKLLYSTCLETDTKTDREKRLLYLGQNLEKIILQYKPDYLAIEKLFFNQNQKTALAVSEAVGVAAYVGAVNKLPMFEFTPLQVKIALTGYGRAEKGQVQEMVKAILKLEKMPRFDDEVDAIAIALTCGASVRTRQT